MTSPRVVFLCALLVCTALARPRPLDGAPRARGEIQTAEHYEPPEEFFNRYPTDNETRAEDDFWRRDVMPPTHTAKRVVVKQPVIVPIGRTQEMRNGSTYNARRFVVSHFDANKASFLLYPYPFSLNSAPVPVDNTTQPETYTDGAFISTLESKEFPKPWETFFHWLNSSSTIDLVKAKAVYDVNVAVLQVSAERDPKGIIDLTYESDSFCTMFYSWMWPKYARCFVGSYEYDQWLEQNPTGSQRPYFMYLNAQNISAGVLSKSTGENRFGVLIIPDIIGGEHTYLTNVLAASAPMIKSFVEKGGVLVSSGKAAMLLEGLGLATAGTFSKKYTMRLTKGTWGYGNGCDGSTAGPADDSEEEFTRRTLCFSPPSDGTRLLTATISGPLLADPKKLDGFTPLAWFDTTLSWAPLKQHDEATGLDEELPAKNVTRSYPMHMYKKVGKGFVVVQMANPSYNFMSSSWIYNAFFLAGSRPLVLDNEVTGGFNRTIPALERVKLQVELKLTNYFTLDIATDVKVKIWYRNGTTTKLLSGACTEQTTGTTPPSPLLSKASFFECSMASLAKLSSKAFKFSVDITDPLVTQEKKDVVLLWPRVEYTDPRGNTARVLEYGVTIGAAMAALIRADMNIDPSSTYPLWSRGSYIDNVLNAENKEETVAHKVVHYSIVPIITPFIDISDQVRMIHEMPFDAEYYIQAVNKIAEYRYPYQKNDVDYLDWDLLYNRTNALAASWDEAVKLARVLRTDFPQIGPNIGIKPSTIHLANYQTNNDNDLTILRQADFRDADAYYEHATQRLMAFLDVNVPGAAKTKWGTPIPASEARASDPTRGKKRILFARHDIFFWKKYVMPLGIPNTSSLISIDRYNNPACGSPDAATVAGGFGNAVPGGMIPREWPNKMLLDCSRKPLINAMQLETATGGKAKLLRYIMPLDPDDAKVAGDLYDFNPTTGTYKDYPEVKFVSVLRAKIDVLPAVSRRGGELVFGISGTSVWPSGVQDAIDKGYITVSADQIAVYKTYVGSDGKLRIRFKRGNMPNEAFGSASHLQINLEGATGVTGDTLNTKMDVYELLYDISAPEKDYEDWSSRTVTQQDVSFVRTGALSMPAARLEFILGDTLENSFMQPYELREPLVRYGVYEQELLKHRGIHGSLEIHPITEPCLVSRSGGFSAVTHIGTSSVPFREYLTTETSLTIPAATETGRVEWTDLWGRRWVQSVRSTIFEYPPIPPPLRNYVMTTTFEILTPSGTRRFDWRSEDTVDVRVQMKLLNNYPKWFEVTNCKANEVLQKCGVSGKHACDLARVFDVDGNFAAVDPSNDMQWVTQGHNASYGICFRDPEVTLSGVKLSAEQRSQIQAITLCAQTIGATPTASCQKLPTGLPVVSRRPEGNTAATWNHATQVEAYWPENYIKPNMWDLTHYDYDDNWYDKAYKYHMDNNLPHLGHVIVKPENLIAFPLFKGLGYRMTYDAAHGHSSFSGKKGWWSDNLQNRDHTVVAGQAKSNDVSVGKPSLIPDSEWVDIEDLQANKTLVGEALKNIYTCRFNRKMPKVHPSGTRGFHLKNVYLNNIVPVPPGFTPSMERQYGCAGQNSFTPDTISQFPNVVYTDTPRDWLYFAANLRGGAKENINVLYQLAPIATKEVKFEGLAKVQDGGRFTYWNPANSRNSYLIVDNPVSTVMAIRNDIEVEQEVIPTYTTTFDSLVFHHFVIKDEPEFQREWTLPIWVKHHGFGDFGISVYVGDAGTTCLMTPGGGRARVKYTFMNNAGFDINMKKNAINDSHVSQEAINANDLMYKLVHTLRTPQAYNFLQFDVPESLKKYVNLKPSVDVVGIAPLFFDFDAINVVTIRDGWKGDYYLDLKITADFPDELRGRMYEIPVSLRPQYFDNLPGKGDMTGIHNYELSMPSIVFAVPYKATHPKWAGKVFYTSGYATDVQFRALFEKQWIVDDAIFVSPDDVDKFRMCLGHTADPTMSESDGEFTCMNGLWNTLKPTRTACGFTMESTEAGTGRHLYNFAPGLLARAPTFPVKVPATEGADESELHLLVRTSAPQLPSGWPYATLNYRTQYNDWAAVKKAATTWLATQVHAKGAWLSISWSVSLLSSSGLPLRKQTLTPQDSGLAQVMVTMTNTGDALAFKTNFTLTLSAGVTLCDVASEECEAPMQIPDGCTATVVNGNATLSCDVADVLAPQASVSFLFRIAFKPDPRPKAGVGADAPLNIHPMADGAIGFLDLTVKEGERTVKQTLEGPFGLMYTKPGPDVSAVLSGTRKGGYDLNLRVKHELEGVKWYIWRSRVADAKVWTTFAVTKDPEFKVDVEDRFEELGGSGEVKVDFVVVLSAQAAEPTLTSEALAMAETNVYEWRKSKSNLLLLLLLLPAIAVPIAIGAAVFLLRRGDNKKPATNLGYGRKAAFVPREMEEAPAHAPAEVGHEAEMTEVAPSGSYTAPSVAHHSPAPPTPSYGAPAVEAAAAPATPASSAPAAGGRGAPLPYGPTYIRGGKGIQVRDTSMQ